MEEAGEDQLLWKSEEKSKSMVSVTLARTMNTLLGARPKKLQEAISGFSPQHTRSSLGSLEDSLWFLHKYVRDAAENKEPFDQLLIPMIENALKCKDSKHGLPAMFLIDWLFQDELLFQVMAEELANIVIRKDDKYLALGWCVLVRHLLECDSSSIRFPYNRVKERYHDLVKVLCTCLPRLASIACKGSTVQDGFELPSRLSVYAADCFLALTEVVTKSSEVVNSRLKSNAKVSNQAIALAPAAVCDKNVELTSKSSELSAFEKVHLLWNHLEQVIYLVQRLLAWSRKSRALHSKGLEQVLKWLQQIKEQYKNFRDKTDKKVLKTGILLLSSCWKHYSVLLRLEDHKFSHCYKEMLEQYLSGIEFCSDKHASVYTNNGGGEEARKFFVNCICLLLGRLDTKRFGSVISEYGMRMTQALLPQLNCTEDDITVGVISIFKDILLKPNCPPGSKFTETNVDAVLPFLLQLLDERDGTSRAVVLLLAEYCSLSRDDRCLKEILKHLSSEKVSQRRNAIDVLSELIHILSSSENVFPNLTWQMLANHLLECLKDEELVIREQASSLLSLIEPSLSLSTLVGLFYSSDESMQSTASDALRKLLKHHKHKVEVISLFLDCLSEHGANSYDSETVVGKGESNLDSDPVRRLILEWSTSVESWNSLVIPLIDKMFVEPSNATIVRFLSYISEHLADAADIVLCHVTMHVKAQKEIDRSLLSRWQRKTSTDDESKAMQQSLFEHLCPLLILKMLPLRVFDNLNSSSLYNQLGNKILTDEAVSGYLGVNIGQDCIASLLLYRASCKHEFEDVRKLAAELCGRIHPQVLLPILSIQLENAVGRQDLVEIKSILFSLCTSLVIRGTETSSHPTMLRIRKAIDIVLLWPSLDRDPVSKAQHGCIDCLAFMICAELQSQGSTSGNRDKGSSVLKCITDQLITGKMEFGSILQSGSALSEGPALLSFRLCMANVLISTIQKISDASKKSFAQRSLPFLIHSVEAKMKSAVRAACIQVLFSAVYHLKSVVAPYASDLLKISLEALRKGSEKERMAGAKLLASLMASEDTILESILMEFMEARSVLSTLSLTDPSFEIREVCKNLLQCISPR